MRRAQEVFEHDLDVLAVVNPDEQVWRAAAEIAEHLSVRTLDAVHLAAAQRLRIPNLTLCTFDLRQGQAARKLGLHVLGC